MLFCNSKFRSYDTSTNNSNPLIVMTYSVRHTDEYVQMLRDICVKIILSDSLYG